MTDPFDLDDRTNKSSMEKTISKISNLFARRKLAVLLKTPLIMVSSGTLQNPYLKINAPYFQGVTQNFKANYRSNNRFLFYILANNFKKTFSSHVLVGYWNGKHLIIFDPNGDVDYTNSESVYQGFGFRLAPSIGGIKNPLYKTLIQYFHTKNVTVSIYRGNPIPCPVGLQKSCVYRALMYIIARVKYGDDDINTYLYTEQLVKKIGLVKNFAMNVDSKQLTNLLYV